MNQWLRLSSKTEISFLLKNFRSASGSKLVDFKVELNLNVDALFPFANILKALFDVIAFVTLRRKISEFR